MLLRPRQRLVAVLNAATNAVVAVLQQMPSHKSETVAPRLASLVSSGQLVRLLSQVMPSLKRKGGPMSFRCCECCA